MRGEQVAVVAERAPDCEDGAVTPEAGRVALIINPLRAGATELAARARCWWEKAGFKVVEDHVGGTVASSIGDSLEFVMSFGGDGTMLRAVQATAGRDVPVVGVNLGKLGYLAQIEPEHLEHSLERLISGDFELDRRMMLAVQVHRAATGEGERHLALNEATLERREPGHTIDVAVEIDDEPFIAYTADGVIVATPTGSTAYNLSARGPVVSPTLRLFILTPISPHRLFDRSVVLGPEQSLRLCLSDGHEGVLVVDGMGVAHLDAGDTVQVSAAPEQVPLVRLGRRGFHTVLREKFSLEGR